MPLYEYQCTACGKLTEKRQKFSDPELTECPHCGGRLERTITAPAVQFKGGGWYADLYSKGGKKAVSNTGGEGSNSADAAKSDGAGKPAESSAAPSAPASTPSSGAGSSTPAAGSSSTAK